MTGPLARRIAELEAERLERRAEVDQLRGEGRESDAIREVIRTRREALDEVRHLTERNADLEQEIQDCPVLAVTAERDRLVDIAVRLARALVANVPGDGGLDHAHTADCADRWPLCLAARVIEERGRG